MKQFFLAIAIIAMATVNVCAQEKPLKGPEAKNFKPWEDNRSHAALVSLKKKHFKKGPRAKNEKVWIQEGDFSPISFSRRERLKGADAKNVRPERNHITK